MRDEVGAQRRAPASAADLMNPLAPTVTWVPFESLERLLLALMVGLFVGLEREWRGKDAGLRTFGLVSLLGSMGAMTGAGYALAALGCVAVLVVILNVHTMRLGQGTELTTSAALLVTALSGILCGLGHTITPVAVAVVTTAMLSWKERMAEFGHRLTAEELRSAVLLGILAFAIYPVLPAHAIDPWDLVVPRVAWITVLLIAGIGFANYLLWKVFGTRGIEFAGFLGGLVNSTVTATELALRVATVGPAVEPVAYRGLLLSVAAMALRNAITLGIFKPTALVVASGALGAMLAGSTALAFVSLRSHAQPSGEQPLEISSPFSLWSALKFGVIFMAMQVVGAVAQWSLGHLGFYAVSLLGGLVSSASAVAAAAQLSAAGKIPVAVAGMGAVLASLASAGVNVVLVARVSKSPRLIRQLALATLAVLALALIGALLTARLTGLTRG